MTEGVEERQLDQPSGTGVTIQYRPPVTDSAEIIQPYKLNHPSRNVTLRSNQLLARVAILFYRLPIYVVDLQLYTRLVSVSGSVHVGTDSWHEDSLVW